MSWDAIVVGAGPAGSATAIHLAGRGRRVLLVDRARFPRDKVCGGCVNARARAELEALGVIVDGVPLRRFVWSAGGAAAEFDLPPALGVSRAVLDAALVARARECGVVVREGVTARVTDPGVVALPEGEERAEVVVLATGLASGVPTRVRRHSHIGVGAIWERRPDAVAADAITMAVGRAGYVGLAPVEDGRLDVAAAIDPRLIRRTESVAAAMHTLLAEHGITAPEDVAWKTTPLLTRTPRVRATERRFLVGDAAGYVEPFTGEGIAWALAGARAIAPIAADGWQSDSAARWESAYREFVGRRQRACRALSRGLRWPGAARGAVAVLRRAPRVARPFVYAVTGGAR